MLIHMELVNLPQKVNSAVGRPDRHVMTFGYGSAQQLSPTQQLSGFKASTPKVFSTFYVTLKMIMIMITGTGTHMSSVCGAPYISGRLTIT